MRKRDNATVGVYNKTKNVINFITVHLPDPTHLCLAQLFNFHTEVRERERERENKA